jgi:putative ABC transport system permease protein
MNKIIESIRLALQSIGSRRVRSFLTMLGIIIGVFSIVLLIGLGEGLKKDITKEITSLGSNIVAVLPGKIDIEEGFNPTAGLGASTLTDEDLAAVRALDTVDQVTAMSLLAGVPTKDDRSDPTALSLAVEPGYFDLFSTAELVAGRIITDEDITNKAPVVVLDTSPRNRLFPGEALEDILGQTLRFSGETLEVIGLVESPETAGIGGPSVANSIVVPYTTAQQLYDNTQIFRIITQVREDLDVDEIAAQIESVLLGLHDDVEDFTVFTQDDLLSIIANVLSILTTAIVGIASISLFVGGIGIMNIMLVSVTERTREIGVRKAIGASGSDILTQFLIEAIILSIIGGALALSFAWVVGLLVTAQTGITVAITWGTISLAVGFSLVVGVVFGVAPATRASRLNPIDALRYE